jgi:NAD(P)-dependent dehydrogenase (short-subunit alcohol dehydrogenase family)
MTSAARRVALVTGAGRGLGRTIAIALARQGFALALISRTFEELQETRRLCEIAARDSLIVLADLMQDEGPTQVCGTTLDYYGRIDVLINGAHTAAPGPSILELETADQDRLLAVNLRAPVALARMAALQMRTQATGGTIINFVRGANGSGDPVAAAAEAGIVAFSRTAAPMLGSDQIKIAVIPLQTSDHGFTADRAMTFIDMPYSSHSFIGALEA